MKKFVHSASSLCARNFTPDPRSTGPWYHLQCPFNNYFEHLQYMSPRQSEVMTPEEPSVRVS
jgi:hypothetical protein